MHDGDWIDRAVAWFDRNERQIKAELIQLVIVALGTVFLLVPLTERWR